jgi:hypothetical protein
LNNWRFRDECEKNREGLLLDEWIHVCKEWLKEGTKAFNSWCACSSRVHNEHQVKHARFQLLYRLLGITHSMEVDHHTKLKFLRTDPLHDSERNSTFSRRRWQLVREAVSNTDQALDSDDNNSIDWIHALLECMTISEDCESFLHRHYCSFFGLAGYQNQIRRRFINPCLRWIECICHHNSKQQQNIQISSIIRHIVSFLIEESFPSDADVDWEKNDFIEMLEIPVISSAAMEATEDVLHGYIGTLVARKLPFKTESAEVRLQNVVMQVRATVCHVLT